MGNDREQVEAGRRRGCLLLWDCGGLGLVLGQDEWE